MDKELEETLNGLVDDYIDWLRRVFVAISKTGLSSEERNISKAMFANSGVYAGHIYILECLDKKERDDK